MEKTVSYELVDLGVENSQYFQGFGTSYTEFTDSVVGAGFTAREAIEDALEQVCSSTLTSEQCEYISARVWTEVEECKLLDKTVYEYYGMENPEDLPEEEQADFDEQCDSYYYVGIRWKIEEGR